jgi:hypothetical protein
LADQIRAFVRDHYVRPARKAGWLAVGVRAGDVHKAMKLKAKLPAVCAALGADTFEDLCAAERVCVRGPLNGANCVFVYLLTPEVP